MKRVKEMNRYERYIGVINLVRYGIFNQAVVALVHAMDGTRNAPYFYPHHLTGDTVCDALLEI